MTIAEIRKLEENREGSLNVVHFQKDGSFYHANDWSAWIISVITFNDEVRMATKDRKPLAVTRISAF